MEGAKTILVNVRTLGPKAFMDRGIEYYYISSSERDMPVGDVFALDWVHYETGDVAKLLILDTHSVGYEYRNKRHFGLLSEFLTFFQLRILSPESE